MVTEAVVSRLAFPSFFDVTSRIAVINYVCPNAAMIISKWKNCVISYLLSQWLECFLGFPVSWMVFHHYLSPEWGSWSQSRCWSWYSVCRHLLYPDTPLRPYMDQIASTLPWGRSGRPLFQRDQEQIWLEVDFQGILLVISWWLAYISPLFKFFLYHLIAAVYPYLIFVSNTNTLFNNWWRPVIVCGVSLHVERPTG